MGWEKKVKQIPKYIFLFPVACRGQMTENNVRSCEKLNASFCVNQISALRSDFPSHYIFVRLIVHFGSNLMTVKAQVQSNVFDFHWILHGPHKKTVETQQKNECSIFPWESLFSLKRKNIIGSLYRAALARYMARCTDQRQFVHTKKECVCAPIQKQQQHSLMCVFCTFIARSLRRLDRQLM